MFRRTMLQDFNSIINYIIQNCMKERRSTGKTECKTTASLSQSFQSLTSCELMATAYQKCSQSLSQYRAKLTAAVSLGPQALKDQLLSLLEQQTQPAYAHLFALVSDWLAHQWQHLRPSVSSRLIKLKYLLPSLLGESYSRIEKELLLQWKKNALLHGLQYLWSHVFGSWHFATAQQVAAYYDAMRVIVSKLSYLLFEPSLLALQGLQIESRLYNFTAVEVITRDKDWPQLVQRVIKPSYDSHTLSFSENYDLGQLNARSEIVDIHASGPLFAETAASIKQLTLSCSKQEIISSLRQYRCNLLKEIEENIQSWRRQKNPKKQVTVEKEDVLSAVIYTLVQHKLDEIGQTLKYLGFLWGQDMQNVLGAYQVDSFRVDLEVAYSYLTEPLVHVELPSLAELEVLI